MTLEYTEEQRKEIKEIKNVLKSLSKSETLSKREAYILGMIYCVQTMCALEGYKWNYDYPRRKMPNEKSSN